MKFLLLAVVSITLVLGIMALADRRHHLPSETTQSTPSPAQMITPEANPRAPVPRAPVEK